jgi:hypothetical protein
MASFSKHLHDKWNINTDLCYTSGCTAEDIGNWRAQFGNEDVLIVEIDMERYDAHQGEEVHELEGMFYRKGGILHDSEANFVFESQSKTVGFTPHGVVYKVHGTRKSGDPNTSTGNSITNGVTLDFVLSKMLRLKHKSLVQGDDGISVIRGLFTRRKMIAIETRIKSIYLRLGFKVKVKLHTSWAAAEFCSSLFWPVDGGFVLGPKIGRRLPKLGFSLHKLTKGEVKGMLIGAAYEMNHIPILSTYVKCTMKMLKDVKDIKYQTNDHQYKIHCQQRHKMAHETIEFFEERYGMDPVELAEDLKQRLNRSDLTTMLDWEPIDTFVAIDV